MTGRKRKPEAVEPREEGLPGAIGLSGSEVTFSSGRRRIGSQGLPEQEALRDMPWFFPGVPS